MHLKATIHPFILTLNFTDVVHIYVEDLLDVKSVLRKICFEVGGIL